MPREIVTQEDILKVMAEVGQALIVDLCEHFKVHRTTMMRKADGLVAQGKLTCEWHRPPNRRSRPAKLYIYGDGSPEQATPQRKESSSVQHHYPQGH